MRLLSVSITLLLIGLSPAAAEQPPSAEQVVAGMIEHAGGAEAFSAVGMLRMSLREEETRTNGVRTTAKSTAYVGTVDLQHLRLEMDPAVVIGIAGDGAWAMVNGKIDDRPQTPRMAIGTLHQKLFPLLLPFSLEMQGAVPTSVESATFEGTPAWAVNVRFDEGFFFGSPIMQTGWQVFAARDDGRYLGAEFQPPEELRVKVEAKGMRFQPLRFATTEGVQLPNHVLVDGIDALGRPTGHVRVTKIETSAAPWDLGLFVDPRVLSRMQDED